MAKLKPNLDFALPASAREFAEGSAEDGTTKTTAKGEVTVKAGKKARKAQIGARVSRELFNQLPLVAANLSIKLGRRVTVQEAVEMALQEYVDEVMGEKKTMKKLHQYRNSGTSAREWRGRVAMLAKANNPQPRTLQFPLDLSPEQKAQLPFDELIRVYNCVGGVGVGSLFDFWASVHLGGFRLFGSGKAASAFRQPSLFRDDEWNAAFQRQSGYDWEWMKPSQIIGRFLSRPRAVGGKDISFNGDCIANELHKFLVGRPITDKTPPDQAAFLKDMGAALEFAADDWKSAALDLPATMRALDEHFTKRGWKLPSLAAIAKSYGPTMPKDAPLAYVGNEATEEQTIHAIYARCAARYGKPADSEISDFVQEEAVTGKNNALYWLFGNGLGYFQSAGIEQIMSDFEIDAANRSRVESVIRAASAIHPCNLFGETHYAKFRSVFGAKVNSWVTNYTNRLLELRGLVAAMKDDFVLPPSLHDRKAADFLSGMDVSLGQLNDLLAAVRLGKDSAGEALAVLLGEAKGNVDDARSEVERFTEFVDNAFGRLQMLKNRINKEREIAEFTRDELRLSFALECAFEIPKWLAPMPRLNNLTGGVPDVDAELNDALAKFNLVHHAMSRHYAELDAWCRKHGTPCDPYASIAAREVRHLQRLNPKLHEVRGDRRARRAILQRILRIAQKFSEPTRQTVAKQLRECGVFDKESDANRLIFESKGAVYRSIFDNSRHQLYKLVDGVLMETDWMGMLDGWRRWLHDAATGGDPRVIEDWLMAERGWYAIMLSGLPDVEYPQQVAVPDLPEGSLSLPLPLRLQLARPVQMAETIQKVFNNYASVLSGLAFMLFRRQFSLKLSFMLEGDNRTLYAPKQKTWHIPARYASAETPLGSAVRKLEQPSVDPETAIASLIAKKCDSRSLGEFMRQAPHDWYFATGLPIDIPVRAVAVDKKTIKKGFASKRKLHGVRIIGGPAYKSVLDRQLIDEATCGGITLIMEMHHKQTVSVDSGELNVTARHIDTRLLIAAPLTETRTLKQAEAEMLFDRVVSIDLGEVGIGYAVFDARTHEKIDSGFKRIPSIRRMMQRTQHYEDRPSFRQKFQSSFNINMSELRENVVGDVCHQINRLCAYFKGFPAIESMSGANNRQLESVYDAVIHRYCYSGTQAHQTERRQYWMGSETWQHPYLMAPEYKDGKIVEGKSKPLNLFPGSSVPSKGNSQQCSCCGRNPLELLLGYKDSEKLPVFNGRLKVSKETMMLFEGAKVSREESQKLRQRGQRIPMERPLPTGEYTVAELRRILKLNIRRANEAKQSPGTTKSRYHCAFADCGNTMHADENAAINIGKKFFDTKVVDKTN